MKPRLPCLSLSHMRECSTHTHTHLARPVMPVTRPQGVSFEVVPPAFEESLSKAALPRAQDYARETARGKALEVAARVFQVGDRMRG